MKKSYKNSGTTGQCVWTLTGSDNNYTLTISGTGDMEDYHSPVPWYYENRESIVTVIINKGVTSIGDYAFSWCKNLTSINIPESVTYVGDYAFSECEDLTSINIPGSVTSIGDYAFSWCKNLTPCSP